MVKLLFAHPDHTDELAHDESTEVQRVADWTAIVEGFVVSHSDKQVVLAVLEEVPVGIEEPADTHYCCSPSS